MSHRFIRIFLTLLVVTVLLSACTGPAAAPKTALRLGWSLWPGYYPMAIAVEKGFFKAHGVEVEPVFYSIYTNQVPDLAAGMIDGAVLTLSDTLFDSVSSSVKVVMVLDNSAGADHIVAGSHIQGIADLRGKRIGVPAATISGQLLIREMLLNNGLSMAEVTFVDVQPENVPGAIPSLIDAGYTYDPFTSEALGRGGQVLFTSADAPGLIVDVLALRREILQNRPEDARAIISAWQEALQFWQANPAEGNAIIAKATGLQPEEISAQGAILFDLGANLRTYTPGDNAGSVYFTAQKALQYLVEYGSVTKPVDINQLLDSSFLK